MLPYSQGANEQVELRDVPGHRGHVLGRHLNPVGVPLPRHLRLSGMMIFFYSTPQHRRDLPNLQPAEVLEGEGVEEGGLAGRGGAHDGHQLAPVDVAAD